MTALRISKFWWKKRKRRTDCFESICFEISVVGMRSCVHSLCQTWGRPGRKWVSPALGVSSPPAQCFSSAFQLLCSVGLISDLPACVGHVLSVSQAAAMIFPYICLYFLFLTSLPPPHVKKTQQLFLRSSSPPHSSHLEVLRWTKSPHSSYTDCTQCSPGLQFSFSSISTWAAPSGGTPICWLWGRDGGDPTFFLGRWLDCGTLSQTKRSVGIYSGTCVSYVECCHCWSDLWTTRHCTQHRGTTATGKDNSSRGTCACKHCV